MGGVEDFHWWQRTVLYQVYVRSFFDTDGDGIGDLPGVLAKLDYLEWLGVSAIWLSPVYPSPQIDFGYDVSDYYNIDPSNGSLADFDRLLEEVHRRGIKLLMDFVPNHTSDQHPWFIDSRSSRTSAHRNWYLWHDPAPGGGPPNNWLSQQNDSAWQFDERTGQYYLHTFFPEQPDLNWRNPAVRLAMMEVMRFWLERGVDGFRIDAVSHLIKDARLRANPPNPHFKTSQPPFERQSQCYMKDQHEVHEVIAWFHQLVAQYGDRILIGETYLALGRLVSYYGAQGLTFPFNFKLISADWNAGELRQVIDKYEATLSPDDWPSWVLGNHDRPRLSSRIGDERLRLAAMLLLTLRGTPTMYYGDELGMLAGNIVANEQLDPRGRAMPGFGRDAERTPMAWNSESAAGFSSNQPWLPLSPEHERRNVAAERGDPASLLVLYRQLLSLRCQTPALQVGDYAPLPIAETVLSYVRRFRESQVLVVLNFSNEVQALDLPASYVAGKQLLSTYFDSYQPRDTAKVRLNRWEGQIWELRGSH